ncbi:MAG: double zinc ribbon domain-containing protein, partial [Spirochaetota bacterium]
MVIKEFLHVVSQILFPEVCILCGEELLLTGDERIPLCCTCTRKFSRLSGKRCRKCSRPLISEKDFCLNCRQRDFLFVDNYSLFKYGGLVKELLYQYK